MCRRIELIAALLSCSLGLIWLVHEASILQSFWLLGAANGSGAGPTPDQPIGLNGTGLYFAGMATITVAVALGAYLHVVQRFPLGLRIVWLAAAVTTLGIGVYQIEPWRLVPTQLIYIIQAESSSWFTPIGVLSAVFAWIAAIAGLPIRVETASRNRNVEPVRGQAGSEPAIVS